MAWVILTLAMLPLFKLDRFTRRDIRKYNREISFPFKYRAEKLYRKKNIYDLLINIKYNQKPVIKGKGSAIFLHIANKKYKPTKGCISIKKVDFLKILPKIKKRTKIIIY